MKKILILSLSMLVGVLTVSAANLSDTLISSTFTDFAGMQNPMNQFNLMEQQRFRQEEYNEFKDMKQQKEEKNKKIELQNEYKQETKLPPTNQNVNFIKENGQVRIMPIQ